MITFQLLSKDGSSLDDAEVLSGRWQAYVEGFVSEAETPGVHTGKVRRPFLRRFVNPPISLLIFILTTASRSLPASARATTGTGAGTGTGIGQDFYARGGLEIKVCVRTYRLFYVSRTEDVLWRVPSSAESERASARLTERDAARTGWLEKYSFSKPAGGVAVASSSEAPVVE